MVNILSQHYFRVYGANKEEIERELNSLKKNKIIHSFSYAGLVGNAESSLDNCAMNSIQNSISLSNCSSQIEQIQDNIRKSIEKELKIPAYIINSK